MNFRFQVNLIVKLEAISMITDICKECSSKKTIDLLDILEKIISKPIEQKKIMNGDLNSRTKWVDNEFIDIHKAVEGLISIFCARVCQHPASITIRTYHIIGELTSEEKKPDTLKSWPLVKSIVFVHSNHET